MRAVLILSLALLIQWTGLALAATQPTPLTSDRRIQQFVYDENTVYELDVYTPFISTVQFDAGEIVESIQLGDSASWQIVRLNRGDIVSVKPLIENAFTNMTVYTDQRVYTFHLRSRRGNENSRTVYRVSFTYPSDAIQEFGSPRPRRHPSTVNSNYYVAGDSGFAPSSIYDDGVETVFVLPAGSRRPAVFRVDASGHESIVNARFEDNRLIADSVSERWTLRIGDEEICVAAGDSPAVTGTQRTAGAADHEQYTR